MVLVKVKEIEMRHVVGGIFGAFALFFTMGCAFLVGCWLDICKHPLEWLSDYWLPLLLILIGFVGMYRDHGKWFHGRAR